MQFWIWSFQINTPFHLASISSSKSSNALRPLRRSIRRPKEFRPSLALGWSDGSRQRPKLWRALMRTSESSLLVALVQEKRDSQQPGLDGPTHEMSGCCLPVSMTHSVKLCGKSYRPLTGWSPRRSSAISPQRRASRQLYRKPRLKATVLTGSGSSSGRSNISQKLRSNSTRSLLMRSRISARFASQCSRNCSTLRVRSGS